MTDKEEKMFVEMLDEYVAKLGEHFEAVQILASRQTNDGKTFRVSRGGGNWFARQGMAHEFIALDVADEQARSIARELRPEPD